MVSASAPAADATDQAPALKVGPLAGVHTEAMLSKDPKQVPLLVGAPAKCCLPPFAFDCLIVLFKRRYARGKQCRYAGAH